MYVDSGAGQSMCSCSSAFVDMVPCEIEITGVGGSLQVYGCGTALFLADDESGQPFLLQIHNCLYGQGHFNLLSVSQLCQNSNNSVDFTLGSPVLVFSSRSKNLPREIRLPLFSFVSRRAVTNLFTHMAGMLNAGFPLMRWKPA